MDKQSKERIKSLKTEKKYEDIYREFGADIYRQVAPSRYKKKDLKLLKKEGRYEDIYNKYGEDKYNEALVKARYDEIKEVKGGFKAALWKIGQKLKIYGVTGLLTASTAIGASSIAISNEVKNEIENNSVKYESEIENYNNKITDYANEVNQMKLSDVQIYMKVMEDMWGSIKGYKNPEKDILGYGELDLATEEGYGVCRNMASDVAKKLNKINPEYNARTKVVSMGKDGYYQIANIERKIIQDNETVQETENQDQEQQNESESSGKIAESIGNIAQKILGNHMVTFVDSPEDNLTLVLDPTNPGIGIYTEGKIVMLNSDKENGLNFETKAYMDAVFTKGGIEGVTEEIEDYLKSFRNPNLTKEEIVEKYGIEAQNQALEDLKSKSIINNTTSSKDKFKQSLKVDEKQIENAIDKKQDITIRTSDLER